MDNKNAKLFKDIFHQRLRIIREQLGYTQQFVADIVGISRTSLNRYENGNREPDIQTIGELAEFYNIKIDWLFGLGLQSDKQNYEKA